MFEPGWILIGSIEDRLDDSTQFESARLKPNPLFYGTPNFPLFFNQTLNSSPSQTSMAPTNTFEPGWILIGFIENHLNDLKLFDTLRLRPIPIFYGTPNFPIFLVRTINSSSSKTSMAATNRFDPCWILIFSIEDRLRDLKQFDPARLKPIPIYYGTPNLPIIIVQQKKLLNLKLPWRLQKRLSRAEFWLVSSKIVWGTWHYSELPGSDPFPFSMGRQTSLYSLFRQ